MKEKTTGGVIMRDNKVIVVTQKKPTHDQTYSLPKGHMEEGEDMLETTYREICEETGLKKEDLTFVKDLGSYERHTRTGSIKVIHMFLFTTEKEELKPMDKDNPSAKWVDVNSVIKYFHYKEDKKFFLENINNFK